MRIVTYNIWNTEKNQLQRLNALYETLILENADIVALQEVPTVLNKFNVIEEIAKKTHYPYYYYEKYPEIGDEEGLAIVSRHPIIFGQRAWENNDKLDCAIRVIVSYNGQEIGITNCHLAYTCQLKREYQMTEVIKMIDDSHREKTHEFLLGDFNCYPESSIYRFLTAQQSLNNMSTKLGWFDLAKTYASYFQKPLLPTLDFKNNPRWSGENINQLEVPARFDWVLLKNCYPLAYPTLNDVHLIGVEETKDAKIVPSDHYGILVDINL